MNTDYKLYTPSPTHNTNFKISTLSNTVRPANVQADDEISLIISTTFPTTSKETITVPTTPIFTTKISTIKPTGFRFNWLCYVDNNL